MTTLPKASEISLADYQEFIQGRVPDEDIQDLWYDLLKLNEEAGEVAAEFAKAYKNQRVPDWGDVIDELGDVLYFVAKIAARKGYTLQDIINENYEKVVDRDTNGKRSRLARKFPIIQSGRREA